eukprot:scaffold91843_cov42-Phaeocystis_antarctica.AAC.1
MDGYRYATPLHDQLYLLWMAAGTPRPYTTSYTYYGRLQVRHAPTRSAILTMDGCRYATALLDQPGRMEAASAAVRQVAAAANPSPSPSPSPNPDPSPVAAAGGAAGGWVVEERSAASHPIDEAAVRELLLTLRLPRTPNP